ncbi:MAG: phosphate regulon sensor histidine kinase PhoR [Luminiphilus sp.]|nr:phosphate regulon sensor histidine kinase PhoR [Luminiphilus sp.]
MTHTGLLALEFRRVLLSMAVGVACWIAMGNPYIGAAAALLMLLSLWGWQLSRLYRWFANPDEMPPLGDAAVRGILRDVYLLRSRGLAQETVTPDSRGYRDDSIGSLREAAMIVNSRSELLWCNDAAEYLLNIELAEEEGNRLSNLLPGKALTKYMRKENFQKPLRFRPGSDPEYCLQFEFSRFGASDRLVFIKDVSEQDKLERMRRDFVGNVSHELRTPLTVIKGYIETLPSLMSERDARLQKPLASMETQVTRMENLIADLLWLAQIETVEGERKEDLVDVCALLSSVAAELRSAWPDRDIALHLISVRRLLGDERELHSAISNLVVNALKYSVTGPVSVKWLDSAVGPVLIVEDEGLGIAAKHIPRLTERFYRVDTSRSQEVGGTGLGLAIVKHVAVSHEAKLFVESQLGEGSCFRVVFPSSRCADPD